MFVDSGNERAAINEAVRVHVMRESHRERRSALGRSQSESEVLVDQITILARDIGGRPGLRRERLRPLRSQIEIEIGPITSARVGGEDGNQDEVHSHLSPPTEAVSQELIEFFRLIYPSAAEGLLDMYQSDAAARSALLAYLSIDRANRAVGSTPDISAPYEGDTLRQLRTRLRDQVEGNSNGTLLAVATMSQFEESRLEFAAASIHWNAAVQLIKHRGGMKTILASDGRVHTALIYLDILGSSRFSTEAKEHSTQHRRPTGSIIDDADDVPELFQTWQTQYMDLLESCRSRNTARPRETTTGFSMSDIIREVVAPGADRSGGSLNQDATTMAKVGCLLLITLLILFHETIISEFMAALEDTVHLGKGVAEPEEVLFVGIRRMQDTPAIGAERLWHLSILVSMFKVGSPSQQKEDIGVLLEMVRDSG